MGFLGFLYPWGILLQVLQRNPEAAMFMMHALANRRAAARRQVASFALVEVSGRVARVLPDHVDTANGECSVS